MGKRLLVFVSIGTALLGSFAIAACVGDEPSSSSTGTTAQGQLGGPCFANGTCNAGLSCELVDGTAKCATATSGSSSGNTSSSGGASFDSGPGGTNDSGTKPESCKFQTTPFPCGDPEPPSACYGATQSCTLTGCGSSDIRWECNSANQCGTACCVPTTVATLTPGPGCSEGTLLIANDVETGAVCSTGTACTDNATQLCQANSDCPVGQRCVPVKIINAPAALNGTIVAACAP